MKYLVLVVVLAAFMMKPARAGAEVYTCAAGYISNITVSAGQVKYDKSGNWYQPYMVLELDQRGFWGTDWTVADTAVVTIGFEKSRTQEWNGILDAARNAFANRVPVNIKRATFCDNSLGTKDTTTPVIGVVDMAIKLCGNEVDCKVPNSDPKSDLIPSSSSKKLEWDGGADLIEHAWHQSPLWSEEARRRIFR